MPEELKIDKRGHALWLTIDRPAQRNAMNGRRAAGHPRRAGRRRHADTRHPRGGDHRRGRQGLLRRRRPGEGLGLVPVRPVACRTSTSPTCCAMPGRRPCRWWRASTATAWPAAWACSACATWRSPADHASFGLPEVKIGLFPAQVLAVLQHLFAPRHIAELCLTGEPIDAPRAGASGWSTMSCRPASSTRRPTGWSSGWSPSRRPRSSRQGDDARRLRHELRAGDLLPGTQIMTLALTEDAKEGRAAFVEKRAPNWTGR